MVSSLRARGFFVLVIALLQTVAAKTVDFPVGISLGQYYLSSAYYNARHELVNVVTIPSSQEWQDHYWKLWKNISEEKYHDPETLSIYSVTFKSIQAATENALSRPIEVRAVTAPSLFFQLGKVPFNLRLVASRLQYFAEEDYDQTIALYNAARLAYNLDNCKVFGFEEGCDLGDEDNFAVVIEFSPHFLTLRFLSLADYMCVSEDMVEFAQYGEIGNSLNPNSGYFQNIASALRDFIDNMIAKMAEYGIKDPKLKVRRIVLAGEASKEGMEDFKKIIRTSLPDYEDRLMFDIDPSAVGAIGAAHRARQWALKNAFLNPRVPVHDDL